MDTNQDATYMTLRNKATEAANRVILAQSWMRTCRERMNASPSLQNRIAFNKAEANFNLACRAYVEACKAWNHHREN